MDQDFKELKTVHLKLSKLIGHSKNTIQTSRSCSQNRLKIYEIHKDLQVLIPEKSVWGYILIICIFGLMVICRLFKPPIFIYFSHFPIIPIFLFLLSVLGYITNQEILYGLAIIGFFPSFLLSCVDLIYTKKFGIPINLAGLLFGSYLFQKKTILNWKNTTILDSIFYIFLRFYIGNDIFFDLSSQIDLQTANLILISSPIIMIPFIYLKARDELWKLQNPLRVQQPNLSNSKFENHLQRLKLTPKIVQILPFLLISFLGLCCAIIRYYISNSMLLIFTLSFWSFIVACIVIFFNNELLDTWVFAVSSPIIFLLIIDFSNYILNFDRILNIFAHIFIVLIGFRKFLKNSKIKWVLYLSFGLILLNYIFIVNYFFPSYLNVNAIPLLFFIYFNIILTSYLIYYKNQKDLQFDFL